MKKILLLSAILFAELICLKVKAQLNIIPTGYVGIGSTSTPVERLHVFGNAVFSSSPTFSVAPMIQAQSTYSFPSDPDYTWEGNTHTGIFHPAQDILAFSTAYYERMRIDGNGKITIQADFPNWYSALDVIASHQYTTAFRMHYGIRDNFYVRGDGLACSIFGFYTFSDSTLKENVTTLVGARSKVLALRGVSYNLKADTLALGDSTTVLPITASPTQIGLIAQEVARVVPEVVQTDTNGIKLVAYGNLAGLFVEAYRDQEKSIDSLRGGSFNWSTHGNAGTNSVSNMIGTTDNASLRFATHDTSRMLIDSLGRVGIDTLVAGAKLSVNENAGSVTSTTLAGYFHNGDNSAQFLNPTGEKIGVQGITNGVYTGNGVLGLTQSIGADFQAYNCDGNNIGVRGTGGQSGTFTNAVTIGGQFNAYDSNNPVAVSANMLATIPVTGSNETGIESNVIGGTVNAGNIYGANIQAANNPGGATGWVYGVNSHANYGDFAVGVWGEGDNGTTIGNCGVAGVTNGCGALNYGLYGSTNTSCSGFNAGAVINGGLWVDGTHYSSDARLKQNILPLTNGISIIKQLNPKSYHFRTQEFPKLSLDTSLQFGLISQDVAQILPNLVTDSKILTVNDSGKFDPQPLDILYLNYNGFIPVLIQGMKEQQQMIDSLQTLDSVRNNAVQSKLDSLGTLLSQLQSQVNGCCGTNERKAGGSDNNSNNNNNGVTKGSTTIPVDLGNAIILNQNDPNPFAEHTSIGYNIPDGVNSAQIVFFDNLGRILKTVPVTERGPGQLDVYAGNLSAGLYSYSLIADGKVIDTKKMVCSK